MRKKIYIAITIDVESDEWSLYRREDHSLLNIKQLPRLQSLFSKLHLIPTYLVTYEVLNNESSRQTIIEIAKYHKSEIGAHLHSWSTPPFLEEICNKNTMLANLPYYIQKEKIRTLRLSIEDAIKATPVSFRSGRWSIDKNLLPCLVENNFKIDTSITPFITWTEEFGLDYQNSYYLPYFIDINTSSIKEDSFLEFPVTIGFNRLKQDTALKINTLLNRRLARSIRLRGILSRPNIFKRLWLSPELSSSKDMIRLIDNLVKNRVIFLNLSFHSTSLKPGLSPFVKNMRDVSNFYCKLEIFFEYIYSHFDVQSLSLKDIYAEVKNTANNRINLSDYPMQIAT